MITSPGTIAVVATGPCDLESTDVRVVVEGCGVCGSNLAVWQGRPWFQYPLPPGAPGHEGWGWVVEIGGDVASVRPGDRVAFLSERAFADTVVVAAHEIVRLPAALAGQPFPGEALGCAFNAAKRCRFGSGQNVAVIGVGFMGAVITAVAVDAGARVIAISRRPFSLDIARAMGASETVSLTEPPDVVAQVRDLVGDDLCSCVVEAVGTQGPLNLAGELTAIRGRLVIAGYHQDGPRSVDMQLWNWRGLDVINAHERDPLIVCDGIRAAVDAIVGGRFDPSPLYTDRFGLDRLDRALEQLASRPDGFLKSLVML